MSQVLIRGIDEGALDELKERAKRHGHSMQKELKMLLEWAVASDWPDETGTVFPPVNPSRVNGAPASHILVRERR